MNFLAESAYTMLGLSAMQCIFNNDYYTITHCQCTYATSIGIHLQELLQTINKAILLKF